MVGARRGAGANHLREGGVARHPEAILPHHLGQAAAEAELVERDDRPLTRFDPEDLVIVARIGHREHAAAIGHQQQFGAERGGVLG